MGHPGLDQVHHPAHSVGVQRLPLADEHQQFLEHLLDQGRGALVAPDAHLVAPYHDPGLREGLLDEAQQAVVLPYQSSQEVPGHAELGFGCRSLGHSEPR